LTVKSLIDLGDPVSELELELENVKFVKEI